MSGYLDKVTAIKHKKYYRLEEVATRWNCTIDDLLYDAKEGKLAIALPPEPITGRFYYILNPSAFSVSESGTNESDAVLVAHTPEHARGLFTDADGNILSEEAWEAMPETERKETERRIYRSNRLPPAYLWNRTFTTDNLFITHEELERFEQDNPWTVGNNAHSDYKSTSKAALSADPQAPKADLTLRNPNKKDDWFLAIRDIVNEFIREYDHFPNEAEAWARLRENPPSAYVITKGIDRGEDAFLWLISR